MTDLNQPGWWRDAVVYQIYPRSFADSNGDGIGDLPGITAKADYLADLGVKVVWLSPVYRSPMDDNGYDIADYRDIDPMFGSLADFEELLVALHQRGIRVVMDLVVNHTSDEHAWFQESAASKDSAKRDWYWWRDARPIEGLRPGEPGTEPSEWTSIFSGSAWQWHEPSQQFYLHMFSTKQPDLNWENPQVREAVYDMMRWWLDKGVDGFRMDVINLISKGEALVSGADLAGTEILGGRSTGPRFHEFIQEMHREVFDAYPDRTFLTVGETPGFDAEQGRLTTDPARKELDMVFQFEHVGLDHAVGDKFVPADMPPSTLALNLADWQRGLAETGWNSLYFENHDQPRSVSRWGDEDPQWRARSAMVLMGILHAHRGTPYVYQGQELGSINMPWQRLDEFGDLETLNYVTHRQGLGHEFDDMLPGIARAARDNARTPMAWTGDPARAGFTTGEPWLAVNPAAAEGINVEAQAGVPDSVHTFTRELIRLRQSEPLLVEGRFELLGPTSPEGEHSRLWGVRRVGADGRALVALANFSRNPVRVPDGWVPAGATRLFGNIPAQDTSAPSELEGWQLVYLVGNQDGDGQLG